MKHFQVSITKFLYTCTTTGLQLIFLAQVNHVSLGVFASPGGGQRYFASVQNVCFKHFDKFFPCHIPM